MATILNSVPADFMVLSGDDAMALPLIALGGRGVISVVSNEIPAEMAQLVRLAYDMEILQEPAKFTGEFHPLMEINFVESNPIPVKAAMAEMGLLEGRLATAAGSAKGRKSARIRAVLESLKLIERAHAAISN